MRANIKNFGKIKEANIEINGITVIAGENNTGKSTVGKAVSCMYNAFHNLDAKVERERLKDIVRLFVHSNPRFPEKFEMAFDKANELLNLDNPNEIEIEKIISPYFENENQSKIKEIAQNALGYLKFDEYELKKMMVGRIFSVVFNRQIVNNIDIGDNASVELDIKDGEASVYFYKNNVSSITQMDLYCDGIYIDNPFLIDEIEKVLPYDKEEDAFNMIFRRNSFYNLQHILAEKLSYSNLEKTSSLMDEAIYKSRVDKLLNRIVETVKGDFVEKEDKFMFTDKDSNSEIELGNLSTGIKSFAIILKLIENRMINDKTMLVLDEPEVHLHPKWQLIYAEILVLLQKEFDLNIIITTHSPYFINAIEIYSAKNEVANRCKYYLAELDSEGSVFRDVTRNTDAIYELLSKPLRKLNDLMYAD